MSLKKIWYFTDSYDSTIGPKCEDALYFLFLSGKINQNTQLFENKNLISDKEFVYRDLLKQYGAKTFNHPESYESNDCPEFKNQSEVTENVSLPNLNTDFGNRKFQSFEAPVASQMESDLQHLQQKHPELAKVKSLKTYLGISMMLAVLCCFIAVFLSVESKIYLWTFCLVLPVALVGFRFRKVSNEEKAGNGYASHILDDKVENRDSLKFTYNNKRRSIIPISPKFRNKLNLRTNIQSLRAKYPDLEKADTLNSILSFSFVFAVLLTLSAFFMSPNIKIILWTFSIVLPLFLIGFDGKSSSFFVSFLLLFPIVFVLFAMLGLMGVSLAILIEFIGFNLREDLFLSGIAFSIVIISIPYLIGLWNWKKLLFVFVMSVLVVGIISSQGLIG